MPPYIVPISGKKLKKMKKRAGKLRFLAIKTIVFLVAWIPLSLYLDSETLVDWAKFWSGTLSGTMVFVFAYVMTSIGFRYEDKS
jgi:hypothetical protein